MAIPRHALTLRSKGHKAKITETSNARTSYSTAELVGMNLHHSSECCEVSWDGRGLPKISVGWATMLLCVPIVVLVNNYAGQRPHSTIPTLTPTSSRGSSRRIACFGVADCGGVVECGHYSAFVVRRIVLLLIPTAKFRK